MNSKVLRYELLGTSLVPATQIAKSLVIYPFSTHSIVADSNFSQNCWSYGKLSSFALCINPLVHANIDAIEFVEVYLPF